MKTRLSVPIEQLKGPYDVIVIGSGYGGSITASRMARATRHDGTPVRVCLLERGREFQPGEYPTNQHEAVAQVQITRDGEHLGQATGLFDFHANQDVNVLVGCGLGGTSLINANVSIHPKKEVFELPCWPPEVRENAALLEKSSRRAFEMLGANHYPDDFPVLHKLEALKHSADTMGKPFFKPPINVTFKDGPNLAGVEQKACNLCGDCVTGCNHSAKNTLIMNYLPDARQHGAEIYTEVAVRRLEKTPEGWRVYYELVGVGREKFDAPELFVTAEVVVVAAGTLGSTEILLRSREQGLPVSSKLGQRFTGNGDVLAFGYNADRPVDGVGYGASAVPSDKPVGPCITGLIDLRETAQLEEGMIIEEGSIPGPIAGLLPEVFSTAAEAIGVDTDKGLIDGVKEKARRLESFFGGPHVGAVRNTQTYLVMTHDDDRGVMSLENDRLRIDWEGVGRQKIFQSVNARLKEATTAIGGTHIPDPLWTDLLGKELITVHPLGGCAMGRSAADGVVDHEGRVFAGPDGTTVHDGLYVADGAIVPHPLGVNPLLTISTLAERNAVLLAERKGWHIDYEIRPRAIPPLPTTIGIEFTETMKGILEVAERQIACEFTLTIVSQNLDDMLQNPAHEARLAGTLTCLALSARPLTVQSGVFHLFMDNPDRPDARLMTYDMVLRSVEGETFCFSGVKDVRAKPETNLWYDTTTLAITVYKGADKTGAVIGNGVLKILPGDLLKQLTTMQILRAPSTEARLAAMLRFGQFFGITLFDVYGGVARPGTWGDTAPRKRRALRAPTPERHPFQTEDGVDLLLTRYQGGTHGPVLLSHGHGVSSRIFSTDTIGTNLVEFLVARGYDVWLLDWRASIDLPASRTQFTGDDVAQHDYPAAVETILRVTKQPSVQAVVHCFGATTFFMSMLSGLKGVRSVVCSQIALDYVVPTATKVKAGLHLPSVLQALGVDSLTAYAGDSETWADKLFDAALHLEPVSPGEACTNKVCHRIDFLYGELYEHHNLNALTHQRMHELFGEGNISAFEHLAAIARAGRLVNAAGEDMYLAEGTAAYQEHLDRLAIPMLFLHGADNRCYLPESTALTYERLRAANERAGESLYSRHVIKDYGHIDCIFGENAARDVYPLITAHLMRTADVGPVLPETTKPEAA